MSTLLIPSDILQEVLRTYRQDSRRACALATEALSHCDEGLPRAKLLRARAMALGSAGEIEAAQTDFAEALSAARAYQDAELEGHCLHGLAVALHHQGLNQEALVHMYLALDVRRETGNSTGLQVSLNALAAFHGTVGNYADAIECLTEAHALAQQNTNDGDAAQTLTNLALVYLESGQLHEALQHFEEALPLYRNSPNDAAECNTFVNYATALLAAGRPTEAVVAAQQSLSLAIKHQSVYQELNAQVALARALPDPEQVETLLRTTQQRASERRLPEPRLLATQALGIFLQARSRPEEACTWLLDALAQAERFGSLSSQATLHEQLAQTHQSLGKFECALHHYQQFHQRYVQLHQQSAAQRIQSQLARQEAEYTRKESETLRRQAWEDPLTQLYNRRYLEEFLSTEIARSHREELPLSIILIDIDNFKQINDQHSHRTGDAVLLALTSIFRLAVRQRDVLVRQSGDEFILIAPETPLPDAQQIAERLRSRVEEHSWETICPGLAITISIGVADLLAHPDPLDLVDQRLYQAKRAGKNRVAV